MVRKNKSVPFSILDRLVAEQPALLAKVDDLRKQDRATPALIVGYLVGSSNTEAMQDMASALSDESPLLAAVGQAILSVASDGKLRTPEGGAKVGIATVPENMSPSGAGRGGAFNEAKRQSGVPTSQQPSRVIPNVDKRGKSQPGYIYEFEVPASGGGTKTVQIRDDAGGHDFGVGNPQNRGFAF